MPDVRLLVIDPQNDFMDLDGAALPVPGADADMRRVAALIDRLGPHLDDLVLTLDSHASYGIERTSFWVDVQGCTVAPFTQITAADLVAGRYRPRVPGSDGALADPDRAAAAARLQAEVLAYLQALEAGARYALVAWPVHCVLGTWGHNIHADLGRAVARWEAAHCRVAERVLKGRNPLTEQYSALRAEVPRTDDPATGMNEGLLARLLQGDGPLLVAGEALSHCVAATMDDALVRMTARQRERTVLLADCMSPVPGFERAGLDFLERAGAMQVQLLGLQQALAWLRL